MSDHDETHLYPANAPLRYRNRLADAPSCPKCGHSMAAHTFHSDAAATVVCPANPVRATGSLYPGLTIRDVLATALVVGSIFGCILLAYQMGRIDERQTRDAVACTPNVDSVRVAPRYVPRGPVR